MNLTRINVAVHSSPNAELRLIKLSQAISRQAETQFTLDGKNFFPHVTLYSPAYPTKNLPQVFQALTSIARHFPAFSVNLLNFESHWGYIGLQLQLSDQLNRLHQQIVHRLNPLRDGFLRSKYHDPTEMAKFSDEQKSNIHRYGYPDVLRLYRPHLTLTRLPDEALATQITSDLSLPLTTLPIKIIAAFKSGSHGTCTQLVQEFPLSAQISH